MGRTGGLLHHGLLQHGLPDNGLPDNGLLDGRQVIDRLLLAGGRLVDSPVLGRRAVGIEGRIRFLRRRDRGHGGGYVIVAVIARAGANQQGQRARDSEHPHIYHSHMI